MSKEYERIRETKWITITGKVDRDIYGSFEDYSPGLYIGDDKIDAMLNPYLGKNVKITIQEIEP